MIFRTNDRKLFDPCRISCLLRPPWNISNFVMLFQAVMKFLSRLVEFKILVNWGMVHCCKDKIV